MDAELTDMILDHMDKGFLENIIDMFKKDEALYPVLIPMLRDERLRVKIGATALVEELVKNSQASFVRLIPELGGLLLDIDPTVRGDAANVLGIIGHSDALPFLKKMTSDPDRQVKDIVREAIQEINYLKGALNKQRERP
jgi:HEAT repeat protein